MDASLKAIRTNNISAVKRFLDEPQTIPTLHMVIQTAIRRGNIEIVKMILNSNHLDPSFDDNFLIKEASKGGYAEIVGILLSDSRVDPTVENNLPIRVAVENSRLETVKLLLNDERVNAGADNNFSINIAIRYNFTKITLLLLSNPNVDPSTVNNVYESIKNCNIDILSALIADSRVNPGIQEDKALEKACKKGYCNMVKILLSSPLVGEYRDKCLKKTQEITRNIFINYENSYYQSIINYLYIDLLLYPTYEIRRHNLPIDTEIEILQNKYFETENEHNMIEEKFIAISTSDIHNSIPELLLSIVLQNSQKSLNDLMTKIKNLEKQKIT